jgi:hypothetical protein
MVTKSAKWGVFTLVLIVLMIVALSSPLSLIAQEKKAAPEVVKAKAQSSRGTGEDPNIKSGSDKNDPKSNTPAPSYKGGTAARGSGPGVCGVRADNYTRYIIKVYVDGSYRGAVGPFDNGTVFVGNGATTFYARADFTDGSYKYWGTWVFNCQHGTTVTWELGY